MFFLIALLPALISGQACIRQSSEPTGGCTDGSVRLICLSSVNSNSRIDDNAGRLEVCRGNVWGTVHLISASSFWSEKNNQVACRQLGFEGALNSIPPIQLSSTNYASSSIGIHYSSVFCDGTESRITDCLWSSSTIFNHNSDVFLVCWPYNEVYTDLHSNLTSSSSMSTIGSIRLVGDITDGAGVVEILTIVGWSTICPDNRWTSSVANTICGYLGYESGTSLIRSISSSLVSPRLVRDPSCSATTQSASISKIDGGFCLFEDASASCSAAGGQYAAVRCSSRSSAESTRLFGLDTISSSRYQGIVEYFANGRWGVVCRPSSTTEVDESICDGFNYDRDSTTLISLGVSRTQMFESRMKPLWVPNLQCNSADRRFSDCTTSRPLGYGTCGSSRDILVVDCGPKSSGGLSGGVIAAIVIPTLIVVGVVIFLIIKKDEWVPALKRNEFFSSLGKCLTCQCLSFPSYRRNVTVTRVQASTAPSRQPASVPPPASQQSAYVPPAAAAAAEPEPEPTLDEAELSKPPPPSYNHAFNLPNPSEDMPPPYSAHLGATPSAPPPTSYAIPQDNPAYPPGANAPYPNPSTPYPNPAAPYPTEAAPYPTGVTTPYPPGANVSLADQAYPPPPNAPSNYPPASFPLSESS